MTLTDQDLVQLELAAIEAARTAGELIATSRPAEVRRKGGDRSLAAQIVTEVDRAAEQLILDGLAPTLSQHGLGLLTEEQEDDHTRFTAEHFWCIDPLDGTLPFVNGDPGYAVSIALVSRSGHPVIGVVFDPVEQTLWSARAGAGTFRNEQPWSMPDVRGERLTIFADRSLVGGDDDERMDQLRRLGAELGLPDVDLRKSTGAVMNACAVLENPPAAYFKFPKPSGGGSLWDFAATACLFHEAGAAATDIHGDPLDLNRADSTFMNHRGVLYATDERIASALRSLH